MEHTVPNRMHPLLAIAAFSLTLVSLVGAASILGLLPNSQAKGNMASDLGAPTTQISQPLTPAMTGSHSQPLCLEATQSARASPRKMARGRDRAFSQYSWPARSAATTPRRCSESSLK